MAVGLKIIGGDFVIESGGALNFVTEGNKCIRDFGKMLTTDTESIDNVTSYYRYNPNYGSYLRNLSRQTGLGRKAVLSIAQELVYTTIQNYLSQQEKRDNLSEGEIITDVSYDVYYDPSNPSVILIPITVTNGQGQVFDLGEFEERIA